MNLRDYVSLIKEIEQLDRRIASLQKELDDMSPGTAAVSDTVTRGKKGKKPLGVVRIEGNQDYRKINQKRAEMALRVSLWQALKAEAEEDAKAIESFIAEIEDPDTRRMLGYYCIDGYPNWDEVAAMMGDGWTAAACRQRYSRFIKALETEETDE